MWGLCPVLQTLEIKLSLLERESALSLPATAVPGGHERLRSDVHPQPLGRPQGHLHCTRVSGGGFLFHIHFSLLESLGAFRYLGSRHYY